MEWFKRRNQKEPTFYESESARIQEAMIKVEPGSAEYEKLMNRLMELRDFTGKEKEMKERLTKEGRANILGRILGIVGLGGLAIGLAKMEKIDGQMLTGSSAETGKGLIRGMFKYI